MPHFLKLSSSQYQQPGAKKVLGSQNVNDQGGLSADNIFYDKYFRYNELLCSLFTFLRINMHPKQNNNNSLTSFYQATLRVSLAILHDFPEFFCDFHFNFVNSLPDHCI